MSGNTCAVSNKKQPNLANNHGFRVHTLNLVCVFVKIYVIKYIHFGTKKIEGSILSWIIQKLSIHS